VSGGLRYDQGKLRWDLLPPDAIEELVRVYTEGAKKYEDRNWEKGMRYGTCVRALKSHLNKWEKGAEFDEELTECRHLAMVAWNALAILTYQLRGVGTDDRPRIQNTPEQSPDELRVLPYSEGC